MTINSKFIALKNYIPIGIPKEEDFEDFCKYIEFRKKQEYEKIISGENKEIETRYDRYVDYG